MSIAITHITKNNILPQNGAMTGYIHPSTSTPNGSVGEIGSSVYVIDYNPHNSHDRDTLLYKIDNNSILSSTKSGKLSGKEYHLGDIILTSTFDVYRLDEAKEDSNHKFSLTNIGKIVNEEISKKYEESIENCIDNVEFVNYKKEPRICPIPTNRGFDYSYSPNTCVFISFSAITKDESASGDASVGIKFSIDAYNLNKGKYEDFIINDLQPITIQESLSSEKVAEKVYNALDKEQYTKKYKFVLKNNLLLIYLNVNQSNADKEVFFVPNCDITVDSGYSTSYANITTQLDDFWYRNADGSTYMDFVADCQNICNFRTSYKNACKALYGVSFYPCIRINKDDIANDYDFYLKIHLKNNKSIQDRSTLLSSDTGPQNQKEYKDPVPRKYEGICSFYKSLEIPLTVLKKSESVNTVPANQFYLSDMAMDKFHPSNNNIDIEYTFPNPNNAYNYHSEKFNDDRQWCSVTYHAPNLYYIFPYINFGSADWYNNNWEMTKKQFTDFDCSEFSPYVRYSNRETSSLVGYNPIPNFRGGESAFFSGMTDPHPQENWFSKTGITWDTLYKKMVNCEATTSDTYDNYVNNIRLQWPNDIAFVWNNETQYKQISKIVMEKTNEYVAGKIDEFVLSPNNVFEIICINKNSGETTTVPITLQKILKK